MTDDSRQAVDGDHDRGESSGRRGGSEFVDWNEEMVRRYDIEKYYRDAHPIVRWVESHRLRALDRFASPSTGDRLLEVGCGAGHVLERFGTIDRTGVDLSATMLERATRRLGPGVPLVRAAAEHLPFEDGTFDIVLCTEVLEHTPDPAAVVRELARVTRATGRIIVSIPNEANIDRAKRVIRRTPVLRRMLSTLAPEANEWHLHQMNYASLLRITEGAVRIERTRAIPNRLVPIRYVALLRRDEVMHVSDG